LYRSPIIIEAFFARFTAHCAPQSVERSDRIAGKEATRGPRRLKGLVIGTQGEGEHPAAGSRCRSLGKKYRTTRDCTSCPSCPRTRRCLGCGGGCACSRVHPHRATRELRGLQGLDTVWGSVPKLLESLRFSGARTTSGVVRRTFALGVLRAPSGAHGGRMPTTSLLTRYSTACPCAQFSKANQKATSTTKSSFPHCILCQSLFSFSFSRVLEFCLFEKNQHHPIEYLRNGERFVKNAETRALTNKVILSYL
jgi:hypothetical protein